MAGESVAILRITMKEIGEYWEASEKMLEYWLVVCAGKNDAKAARSLATIRHAKRHL